MEILSHSNLFYSVLFLKIILDILRNEILPELRVYEFFQVDIDNLVANFEKYVKGINFKIMNC